MPGKGRSSAVEIVRSADALWLISRTLKAVVTGRSACRIAAGSRSVSCVMRVGVMGAGRGHHIRAWATQWICRRAWLDTHTHTGISVRRVRVRSLGSIVATVVLALLIGSPPVVDASNFGSAGDVGAGGTTNGVFLTDGADWRVARRSLATANSTAVANAASDYSATSLNAFVSSPTSCTDASHDVCVFDSAYGNNGFVGWNACAGVASGNHAGMTCSLNYVRFNQTYSFDPLGLACHELGHAVGLRHDTATDTCMHTPTSSARRYLSVHDRDNLNWWYCNWGPC